ncbi:30S ribosomal protein S20 [Desulfobulbus oligotrophicus]|jgi:small subunit ribosomal protein S20|uniref:Small ribosomal subunit protein bS20 n=1 Tax=Desulfobulbus oligotrophicus TaxID=1909699 RepID=A0A7T5VDQ1_9BACT|nr:30S ribosomal protein S20 [Desulfobulbus oligotrophicus]MDY0389304.1 30S ribosomal protein S20 [Desulfobulbus oligotrophicus]QQG66045.1 30S ribosomal protein S20 [Desulfobulbus oligotrophicus]
MANHKSAEKRDRQSKVRRLRNRMSKSTMKTAIRQVEEAIVSGSEEQAKAALQAAIPVIYKTATKGTVHKNTAARKVSRLTKRVNKMQPLA